MLNVNYNYVQSNRKSSDVSVFTSRVEADGGIVEASSCLSTRIGELKSKGIWSKASAVWFPHGYKEGKLYAVKGGADADLTFSRAGTRTRKGQEYIEQVPYNLFLGSSNFGSSWGKSNLTQNDETFTVNVDGNNTVSQSVSVKEGEQYTATWKYKRGTSTNVFYRVYNTSSGTNIIGKTSYYNNTSSDWTEISITFTIPAGCTNASVFIAHDAATGTFFMKEPMLTKGVEVKDYFETTTRQNVPALDYTYSSTCPSLLLEPARTNLCLYSETLDSGWAATAVNITANATIAPDGLSTADKVIPTTTSTAHYHNQTLTVSDGVNYTISVYAKAGGYNYISLAGFGLAGASEAPNFDLSNGTVDIPATTTVFKTASIEPVLDGDGNPNGWYRCICTFLSSTTDNFAFIIPPNGTANDNPIWSGDGTSGVYVWGVQIEQGTSATSYIPTTTTTASRVKDAVTHSSLPIDSDYTWCVEIDIDKVDSQFAFLSFGGAVDTLLYYVVIAESGGKRLIRCYDQKNGLSMFSTGAVLDLDTNYRISVRKSGNAHTLFVNGVKYGSAYNASNLPISKIQDLGFTQILVNNENQMRVNEFSIYSALTDAEAIALTTI